MPYSIQRRSISSMGFILILITFAEAQEGPSPQEKIQTLAEELRVEEEKLKESQEKMERSKSELSRLKAEERIRKEKIYLATDAELQGLLKTVEADQGYEATQKAMSRVHVLWTSGSIPGVSPQKFPLDIVYIQKTFQENPSSQARFRSSFISFLKRLSKDVELKANDIRVEHKIASDWDSVAFRLLRGDAWGVLKVAGKNGWDRGLHLFGSMGRQIGSLYQSSKMNGSAEDLMVFTAQVNSALRSFDNTLERVEFELAPGSNRSSSPTNSAGFTQHLQTNTEPIKLQGD